LDHIREVKTPSPTEKDIGTGMKPEDEKLDRRSTFDSPPVYGLVPEINVEPVRSSSTPPSPTPNKNVVLFPSGSVTPTPTPVGRFAVTPPSPLTEAVLRGRLPKTSSARVSTAIGNSGTVTPAASGVATPTTNLSGIRPMMKGRFKSIRLEDALQTPPIANSKTHTDEPVAEDDSM